MFTSNDNSNKHKVANVVLVILLVILRQCHSHIITNATEVISHSSRDLPKNIKTDVSVMRGYGADKSISEKLQEIRVLLRSLIFDWKLDESEIEKGRTFGRIRMMRNLFLPAAFLGGFLTAVILGIKMIGVVNMFLISGLLALNFALIVGKLLYVKKAGFGESQNHYHSHFNKFHGSFHGHLTPSHGWDRYGQDLPFARNFPSKYTDFQDQELAATNQIKITSTFDQPSIMSQYPTTVNNLHQPKQPPTNSFYQPQANTIPQNNPFSGIQMQTPQQWTASNSFNQAVNQPVQMQAFNNDMNMINSNDAWSVSEMIISTTPSTQIINSHETKAVESSLSPREMEKILTDALSRISESKRALPTATAAVTSPNLNRFKRKLSNHRHPYVNLLKPFS